MLIRVTSAPDRAELRRTWRQLSQALQDPDVELDVEAFAALLSVYKQLRDAGEKFDAMLVALMVVLERQASRTDDGGGDAEPEVTEEEFAVATSYSTDATHTSDECLTEMIERQRQERKDARGGGGQAR